MPGLPNTVNESSVLRFAKLSEHATAPSKGSDLAAGYDLCSAHDCEVPVNGQAMCKTDIQIAVPLDCYGRVAPRSGLASKHSIDVLAGVIDADYRGNVGVILFNHSNQPFKVNKGDRIAQLICERIRYPELQEINWAGVRADPGFNLPLCQMIIRMYYKECTRLGHARCQECGDLFVDWQENIYNRLHQHVCEVRQCPCLGNDQGKHHTLPSYLPAFVNV